MSITRLATVGLMMLSTTFAATVTVDGKEYDLNKKVCLINYRLFKDQNCKDEMIKM